MQESGGQRCIDPFKEFEEDQANRVAVREQTVASGAVDFDQQAFGSQLGEIVSQRSEAVVVGGRAQRSENIGVDLGRGEHATGGNVGKAEQCMHQCELAGMVEFEARDPFAVGEEGGLAEPAQLAAVDKGFQDVLLDVEIIIHDGGEFVAQFREMGDGLFDSRIGHIVGGRLGPQQEAIAHIVL